MKDGRKNHDANGHFSPAAERSGSAESTPIAQTVSQRKADSLAGIIMNGNAPAQLMEDEELQGKFDSSAQLMDEEELQGKFDSSAQLMDDEELQGKFESSAQLMEDEELQGKFDSSAQLTDDEELQGKFESSAQLMDEDNAVSELQGKFESSAQLTDEDNAVSELQGKFESSAQLTDDEELQGKFESSAQLTDDEELQGKFESSATAQRQEDPNSMPADVQAKMESTMGADFSDVNIHANSSKASDVGALAFAQGNDVHFAQGKFDPVSTSGQELIGHELAHVVQQREGRVEPTTEVDGLPVNDDPALEQEADELGSKAARS